jgi:hypothetical protein
MSIVPSSNADFLSARQLAMIMYRMKFKALRRSNASNKVRTLENELKNLMDDLLLGEVEQTAIDLKQHELNAAKEQRSKESSQTYDEAELLASANTIFQYILDEFMRPGQRLNSEENKNVILRSVREANGDTTIIIDWNDAGEYDYSLQAVCKLKFITVPDDVIFEKLGASYKRANTDIYQEAEQFVIPDLQKNKINFCRDRVAPVNMPR